MEEKEKKKPAVEGSSRNTSVVYQKLGRYADLSFIIISVLLFFTLSLITYIFYQTGSLHIFGNGSTEVVDLNCPKCNCNTLQDSEQREEEGTTIEETEDDPYITIRLSEGEKEFEYRSPNTSDTLIMKAEFPANSVLKYYNGSDYYTHAVLSVNSKELLLFSKPPRHIASSAENYTVIENPYFQGDLYRIEDDHDEGLWIGYTTEIILDEKCYEPGNLDPSQIGIDPPCTSYSVGDKDASETGESIYIDYIGDAASVEVADGIMSTFRFVRVEKSELGVSEISN